MKKCLKCGKEIQDEAILCRYCHTRLDEYEQRQAELQHFIDVIEKLGVSPREDYEKEVNRINGCLEVLGAEIDVSEAKEKLEQEVLRQKDWKNEKTYQLLISKIDTNDMDKLRGLKTAFTNLGEYKEAVKYKEICEKKIEDYERIRLEKENELKYQRAISKMQDVSVASYEEAFCLFCDISEYKDSEEKMSYCSDVLVKLKEQEKQQKLEEMKKEEEKEAERIKKQKRIVKIVILVAGFVVCGSLVIVGVLWAIRNNKYEQAVVNMEAGKYNLAKEQFEDLEEYKDSKQLVDICNKELQYEKAILLKEKGDYLKAIEEFSQISGYSDCNIQIAECKYLQAVQNMEDGNLETAIEEFENNEEYGDSKEKIKECRYLMGKEYMATGEYEVAMEIFEEVIDYGDSAEQIEQVKQEMYANAMAYQENKEYQAAIEYYSLLVNYSDSEERITQCKYGNARLLFDSGNYEVAVEKYREIIDYSDSKKQIKICQYEIACKYMRLNKYQEAVRMLEQIDGEYSDSKELIQECKYLIAVQYMEDEKYALAAEIFSELGNYSDSTEQIKLCEWASMEVGDTVVLGTYEQDNNIYTSDEEIEWIVLKVENGQALLLSKYVLDAIGHNNADEWSKSEIREWMQQKFYYNAFSEDVRNIIVEKTLITEWTEYQKELSETTKDKVFLLSEQEVIEYLGEYSELAMAIPSVYADKQGVEQRPYFHEEFSKYCYWSLRTPGWNTINITYVDDRGQVIGFGDEGQFQLYGIRPAIWVTLKPAKVSSQTATPKPMSTPITTGIPEPEDGENKLATIIDIIKELNYNTSVTWWENELMGEHDMIMTYSILDDESICMRFEYDPPLDYVYYYDITLTAPEYNTGKFKDVMSEFELCLDNVEMGYVRFHYNQGVTTYIEVKQRR